jgi:hypothetical protein
MIHAAQIAAEPPINSVSFDHLVSRTLRPSALAVVRPGGQWSGLECDSRRSKLNYCFEVTPSQQLWRRLCGLGKQSTRGRRWATFTVRYKSALGVGAAPDDPSRIDRGPVQGFPLAKISESRFLSSRKRSNTIPRATWIGWPSPLG